MSGCTSQVSIRLSFCGKKGTVFPSPGMRGRPIFFVFVFNRRFQVQDRTRAFMAAPPTNQLDVLFAGRILLRYPTKSRAPFFIWKAWRSSFDHTFRKLQNPAAPVKLFDSVRSDDSFGRMFAQVLRNFFLRRFRHPLVRALASSFALVCTQASRRGSAVFFGICHSFPRFSRNLSLFGVYSPLK